MDGVEIGQHAAAIREKLLAFYSQDEAPPDAVEQSQAQLLLKISDLSRKCRLSNAQAQRGLRYSAEFGDRNEGSQAPEVHGSILCLIGIQSQSNYALDMNPLHDHAGR